MVKSENGIYQATVTLEFDEADKELFDRYFMNRNGHTLNELIQKSEGGIDSVFNVLMGEAIGRLNEMEQKRVREDSV